jgi:IgGFc binding protein
MSIGAAQQTRGSRGRAASTRRRRRAWARSALPAASLALALATASGCGAKGGSGEPAGDGAGGGAHGTGSAATGGNVFVDGCAPGSFVCDGDSALPCDAAEGAVGRDCAAEGGSCRAPLGCVVCEPLTGSCQDGVASVCNSDGTRVLEFQCDTAQGMVCEPDGCKGTCSPAELGSSYVGCDYYPTVTVNPVFSGFSFAVAVANTGAQTADVRVTRGDALIEQVSVAAGSLQMVRLPWVTELKGGDQDSCQRPPPLDPTRVVAGGAYRLRSTRPVSVYQFNPLEYELSPVPEACPLRNQCPGSPPRDEGCLSFSNDASLLFPTNVLTGSYGVLSWPSTAAGSGFISVTGTEPGTTVRIRGRGRFSPGAGISDVGEGTIVLGRGDVLQLLAEGNDSQTFGSDISGTIVEASAPVQVIAGSSCGFVPTATTQACDHLEQAMLPAETLGNDYLITFPAAPASQSPHVVRILPVLPDTAIELSPAPNGVMERVLRGPADGPLELDGVSLDFRVHSDKPVLIAHYLQGQSSVDSGAGDPSMAVAVPLAQYRDDYIFAVSKTYDYNFVNVVAPSDATVLLDGEALPDSAFVDIGTTGFHVARHMLPADREVFHMVGTRPFGIVVYGYGKFTSYMYPGGLDLRKIAPPIIR